jgi:hypothetical protein
MTVSFCKGSAIHTVSKQMLCKATNWSVVPRYEYLLVLVTSGEHRILLKCVPQQSVCVHGHIHVTS